MPRKISTAVNNTQESNLVRPDWRRSVGSAFLSVLLIASTLLLLIHSGTFVQADSTSFVFTTTGDYGSTQYAINNVQYIGRSATNGGPGANFNLGLGDFNYDTTISADTWYTNYVKSNLPANFPFEIVAGDHDTQLSQLTADLPPNGIAIGSQSTAYGQEYYFDYPAVNPLARFILLTPLLTLHNGQKLGYNYSLGTSHYNWVSQRISDARSAGIPWVIVGMSRGCLYINSPSSSKACTQPDYDLMNMLLSKDAAGHPHADLILQAHLHYYARSYQLAINNNCSSLPIVPKVSTDQYNAGCVVDSSSNLTKDAGTVIVTTGTGGKSLVSIDATDIKSNYFINRMGANSANAGYGVSQFTISANQLSMKYDLVSQTKGTAQFQDSFTITSSGGTSTPSPSPSATTSATTSPTPGMTLAQDNFQRANQTYWGKASDGQMWGGDANSSNRFSINNDMGQVAANSTYSYSAVLGPSATNAEVLFTGTISSFSGANQGAVLRWTDSQDWYKAYIDGTNLVLQKKVNGTLTRLKSVAFAGTAGASYTLRFNVTGSTLSASVWPTSGSDPGSWMVTVQDSSLSSGYCGLHTLLQSAVTALFTSFQATAE